MNTSKKKKGISNAIIRYYRKLRWQYETLLMGPARFQVDLGKRG